VEESAVAFRFFALKRSSLDFASFGPESLTNSEPDSHRVALKLASSRATNPTTEPSHLQLLLRRLGTGSPKMSMRRRNVKRVAIVAGLVLIRAVSSLPAALAQTDSPKPDNVILPSGTKIELAVTAPVWMRTARPGDALYTQVDFPAISGKSIAIPSGTYVQGTILSITRPSHFKSHAEIQALFSTLIFANGYAVPLPALPSVAAPAQDSSPSAKPPAPSVMKLNIDVNTSNDLLLDDGAQFNIVLASPLSLDPAQIAAANAVSRPVDLGALKSATLCRPTPGTPGSPGTPGTPDTVIPGTPGTPPITIPGGPGMPDTVIPGTPATPPTVIPGSPGTPGTPGFPGRSCPRAPLVTSSELVSTSQPQRAAAKTSPNNP
jgi:hypothetical protein